MRIWSRREVWLFSFSLSILGLLVLLIPYIWIGVGFQPLPTPLAEILVSIGVAVFLSGTVSFGVQELIRARTKDEFGIQLRNLLSTTGDKLNAEMRSFLETQVEVLGRQIEELGAEIYGSKIKMIYSSREKGLAAMAEAIREANRFVYVMGISLRQLFLMDTG